jgi:hypothetical protein
LQPVLSKCPKCITWKGNTNSVFLGKENGGKEREFKREKRRERGEKERERKFYVK